MHTHTHSLVHICHEIKITEILDREGGKKKMSLRSRAATELDKLPDTLLTAATIKERGPAATTDYNIVSDTCESLSNAVSVSLALGAQQNDITVCSNYIGADGAFEDTSSPGDDDTAAPAEGAQQQQTGGGGRGRGTAGSSAAAPPDESFGVSPGDMYRLTSCMELLRGSSEEEEELVDVAAARSACPAAAAVPRYHHHTWKESNNLFMDAGGDGEQPLPACHLQQGGVWCVNDSAAAARCGSAAGGDRFEPKRGGGGPPLPPPPGPRGSAACNSLCKHCNYGQSSSSTSSSSSSSSTSSAHCRCVVPSAGGPLQDGAKGALMHAGVMMIVPAGRGQVESYPSEMIEMPPSHHHPTAYSPSHVKREAVGWVDMTRYDALYPGVSVYLSDRRVCQVCGDDASGCHYGAVTCGSCKVFFKRAAAGKQNHLCASRNDCTIDKLRRKNCASCRLRRCFLSGMSLKGRRPKGVGQARGGEEEQNQTAWGMEEGVRRPAMEDPDSISRHAQEQSQVMTIAPTPSLRSCLSLLSILRAIEPAVVNAGHNQALPDSSSSLLTSLNELGERQLVNVVRWAKGLPGFRELHVDDQMSVIQSSWMGVMVFALGWRSYTLTNGDMLYFAPDLVFNDQRMQVSSMYDHCVRMKLLSQRFCVLRVTQDEFLCMKALLLFSIMPVDGLRSQRCFDELRTSYIKELDRLASHSGGETTRTQRLFQLTQLLDSLQPIVRKLHQFTYDLFLQAQSFQTRVSFPEMISEIVSVHVPKILTGMVRPIFFHKTA